MSNPPWATSASDGPMESTSRASSRSIALGSKAPITATTTNPAPVGNVTRRTATPSSRSTCPWDQGNDVGFSRAELPTRVRQQDDHDTCPWATDGGAKTSSASTSRRPTKTPLRSTRPWAVQEDERLESDRFAAPTPQQPTPVISQPASTEPQQQTLNDQLSMMKRELVMKMMAEECSEDQILQAMEKLDIQYGDNPIDQHAQMPAAIATGGAGDTFTPLANFSAKVPSSPSAASVQSTQYEEACTAARATAAKSQGQGVASVFYG